MPETGYLEFEVKGLSELKENLKRLPQRLQEKALASAVLAGAGVIRDEARRLCPKKTGRLAKSIVAKKVRDKNRMGVTYQVGPKLFYGHMVEFGTSPHEIKAKKLGKVLKLSRWRNVYARVIEHPGAPAKPFLRPAFDNKFKEATEKLRQALARSIERGEVIYWKQVKGW